MYVFGSPHFVVPEAKLHLDDQPSITLHTAVFAKKCAYMYFTRYEL